MTFTLGDIRSGIREVTGNPTENELSTSYIDDKINKFYRFVLPDDLKPFLLLVDYKFQTIQNQVFYKFDLETYISLEPEFFCNGLRLMYYQNRSLWLRDYQYQFVQEGGAVGNGSIANYSGTVMQTPITPGTFSVADSLEYFTDDTKGTLVGSKGGIGAINYTTGVYGVIFNNNVPNGDVLQITYAPIINGRPMTMYYDGQGTIQFFPIPDGTYEIEGSAYIMPTAMMSDPSTTPLLEYLGYTIMYGTSLEIFKRREQFEQVDKYQPVYDKYLDLALSRSTQQDSNQRTVSKW